MGYPYFLSGSSSAKADLCIIQGAHTSRHSYLGPNKIVDKHLSLASSGVLCNVSGEAVRHQIKSEWEKFWKRSTGNLQALVPHGTSISQVRLTPPTPSFRITESMKGQNLQPSILTILIRWCWGKKEMRPWFCLLCPWKWLIVRFSNNYQIQIKTKGLVPSGWKYIK